MEDFIKIGIIVKPQGIKGEVKVKPLTDDISRFDSLKKVYIGGVEKRVLSVKRSPDFAFLLLSGVEDRNASEMLRNMDVFIRREDAVKLEEGSYFIQDIIGCIIYDEEQKCYGKIIDVTSAKTDYFTVDDNGRIMRFPFLKRVLVKVDTEAKKIIVKKDKLLEVAFYED